MNGLLTGNESLYMQKLYDGESMAGSLIQATGTVEFEDGLRTIVFQEDSWRPYSGQTTLESDMARPWRLALTLV